MGYVENRLLTKLESDLSRFATGRLLVVAGAMGSGKSSLIAAFGPDRVKVIFPDSFRSPRYVGEKGSYRSPAELRQILSAGDQWVWGVAFVYDLMTGGIYTAREAFQRLQDGADPASMRVFYRLNIYNALQKARPPD